MSSTTPMAPGMYTATGAAGSGTASPYLSTAGIVWGVTNAAADALTSVEVEELRQLELQLMAAKRIERVAIFKSLPSDIRQNIVNQLILDEAISKMRTCSGEGFELSARLAYLKSRAAPSYGYSGTSSINTYGYQQPSTSAIIEFLTKQEVINAHLEQCIEDSLLNAPTDSI